MLPRQRVLAAINHEEPDRVPICIGVSNATSMKMKPYRAIKQLAGIDAPDEFLYQWPELSTALPDEATLQRLHSDVRGVLDLEPAYAETRALHPTTLEGSRDKLFWFLCGWTGGPDHYIERFGHPRLRARHMPFPIGIRERDQWMACMVQAMQEQAVDPALAGRLAESFFGTADWMRNKGG